MPDRKQIIQEASEMFITQGIKSVRMDDIAAQLGMSKRTLYEMFGGKEELLSLCMDHYWEMMIRKRNERNARARNVMEAVFQSMANMLEQRDTTLSLMVSLRRFYPRIYTRVGEKLFHSGCDALRQLIERGVQEELLLPDLNVELTVITFIYSITGLMRDGRKHLSDSKISLPVAFGYVAVNFFRGNATEKGREVIDEYIRMYNDRKINMLRQKIRDEE